MSKINNQSSSRSGNYVMIQMTLVPDTRHSSSSRAGGVNGGGVTVVGLTVIGVTVVGVTVVG